MENTSKHTSNEMREIMQDLEFLEWAAEYEHNRAAMFLLATKYYYGDGVAQDAVRAVEYLKRSAELGDIESAQLLAIAYRDGEGIKQDYEKCVKWFLVAANAGLTDSMYSLFLRYKNGQGVQQSINQAMNWLIRASNAGHSISQRILGECYYYGDNGLPEDKRLAYEYCLQSAQQGDAEGCYRTGLAFLDGVVVERNLEQAKYFLRKASYQNFTEAQLTLSRVLLREKTETSFKEVADWLTRGAALTVNTGLNYSSKCKNRA